MSQWDDELKAKAIEMYQDAEPTAENSMEIVNEIAQELGQSPNGVRMILSKAEVYVKKAPAAKAASSGSTGDKAPRVSKEAAHQRLADAIAAATEQDVDMDIVSKLTGKAALYFAELFEAAK